MVRATIAVVTLVDSRIDSMVTLKRYPMQRVGPAEESEA